MAFTDRLIVNNWKQKVSVRSQRFRLDKNNRLYDMQNDFGQRKDVSKKFPEVKERLKTAADKYRAEVLSELPKMIRVPLLLPIRI